MDRYEGYGGGPHVEVEFDENEGVPVGFERWMDLTGPDDDQWLVARNAGVSKPPTLFASHREEALAVRSASLLRDLQPLTDSLARGS